MLVFGGKGEDNYKLDDLWVFSFSTYCWDRVAEGDFKPLPRSGHSASIYRDQYMIVFGGILDVTKELDDVVIYDLKAQKWL